MNKKAKAPTSDQAAMIEAAGLVAKEWLVLRECSTYLDLTDRSLEQRDHVRINKRTRKLVMAT